MQYDPNDLRQLHSYSLEQLQQISVRIHGRRSLTSALGEKRIIITLDELRLIINMFDKSKRGPGKYVRSPGETQAPRRGKYSEDGGTNCYSPELRLQIMQEVRDNPTVSMSEIARNHGINRRTVWRWINNKR